MIIPPWIILLLSFQLSFIAVYGAGEPFFRLILPYCSQVAPYGLSCMTDQRED